MPRLHKATTVLCVTTGNFCSGLYNTISECLRNIMSSKIIISYANRRKDAERRLKVKLSYTNWKLNFLCSGESKGAAPQGFVILLLCRERASPEGTILKIAFYYTKQWYFSGEPCIQFATPVEEWKKNLSVTCPLLMPHVTKAYGSTSELFQLFVLRPFKNKPHATLCCFADCAH